MLKNHPKAVYLIIVTEFCERFSFYGMRAILVLYIVNVLKFDEHTAVIIYHSFAFLSYFFPLFGGIIADVCIGKFRTIVILSVVYAIGNIIQATSATPLFSTDHKRLSIILSLVLIAVGTGGIKPCVSAFGGDQYKMPEQAKELTTYYSFFYFSINVGSLASTFITPILRNDIHCFGEDRCFPLAFGVPAVLMLIALVLFVCGKSLYVIKTHEGNVVVNVGKCVCHALCRKLKSKEKRSHWLDYSLDRFDEKLVDDTKASFRVLKMFLPLPFFWALFDQQGSRWTLQATRMDGRLGPYTIKPDQMQLANSFLVLTLIPIFDSIIYPLLDKCRLINKPLQRLTVGGLLAALSFIVSALVQLKIEETYPVLPKPGFSQVRIFNGLPCEAHISSSLPDIEGQVESLGALQLLDVPANGSNQYSMNVTALNCPQFTNNSFTGHVQITEAKAVSVFIHSFSGKGIISQVNGFDVIDKEIDNPALLRVLYSINSTESSIKLINGDFRKTITLKNDGVYTSQIKISNPGKFELQLKGTKIATDIEIGPAGIYTLILGVDNNNHTKVNIVTVTPPNSVHMLWLLPQYLIITAAEIMFSITGINFAYTQAPESMRSLMSASWLLTTAFGNLIVVFIAEFRFIQRQTYEFLLFAALMAIDMFLFMIMAILYEYSKPENIPDFERGSFLDLTNLREVASKVSLPMRMSVVNRKPPPDPNLFQE